MNKKALVTALVLGGAVVYAIKKLTQRNPQQTVQPAYHRASKHLTNVFARAKATALRNGNLS